MTDQHRIVQEHLEKLAREKGNPTEILQHLEAMSPRELTGILPALFSTGYRGEEQQALRDTVTSVLYRKLTDSLIDTIKTLDASTARLSKVGWWMTIVVGIVGIVVSLVLAFPRR